MYLTIWYESSPKRDHLNMQELLDRLRQLREKAGFKTLKEAADRYGVGYETYKKAAKDTNRPLRPDDIERVARWHKVTAGWLMFGEGPPTGFDTVEIMGEIRAGQAIVPFDDERYEPISISLGDTSGAAFIVSGNSMFPLAHDRDIIFVGRERKGKDVKTLIGHECAITLQDSSRLFKVLERGSKDGYYDLHSYNAEPLRDAEVHSAGRFLGLKRR